MASKRLPSSSICSSLRRATGLLISVVVNASSSSSKLYLDVALRGIYAGPDRLALRSVDLPVSEIANLYFAQLSHARVADPLATAERKLEARLLSRHQDRRRAIRLGLGLAPRKADLSALALLRFTQLGLEALHVKPVEDPLGLPVIGQRVEHVPRPGGERLSLAPVGAQLVEVRGLHPALGAGQPQPQSVAIMPCVEVAQAVAEDDLPLRPGGVQVDRVPELATAIKRAQHAHDRRHAASGADEQQLLRKGIGQLEVSFGSAEADDGAGLDLADEKRRHLSLLHELRRRARRSASRPANGRCHRRSRRSAGTGQARALPSHSPGGS